jgi:hypothetical protein
MLMYRYDTISLMYMRFGHSADVTEEGNLSSELAGRRGLFFNRLPCCTSHLKVPLILMILIDQSLKCMSAVL